MSPDPTNESRRTITSMLNPDIDNYKPSQFDPSPQQSKLGWIGGLTGCGILIFLSMATGPGYLFLIGLLGIPVCIFGIHQVVQENVAAAELDRQRLAHYQNQDLTKLKQREVAVSAIKDYEIAKLHSTTSRDVADTQANAQVKAAEIQAGAQVQSAQVQANAQMHTASVQADAQIQSARYQALAAAGERQFQQDVMRLGASLGQAETQRVREFTALEAQLDREHSSEEAEKDRQATLEQMITRFEGKIKEIETRMEYESPNAHKRSQEELITLRGRMAMMREINEIKNPTERKQMFDQFKKGWA